MSAVYVSRGDDIYYWVYLPKCERVAAVFRNEVQLIIYTTRSTSQAVNEELSYL